ncbi:hypothetical protein B9Z55_026802 [Caenorhabditis nigoni]|nr:hypothetical protein B9Z55_026802 [Caenorhabditis nigoni]
MVEDEILIMKEAFLANANAKKWQMDIQNSGDYGIIYEALGRIRFDFSTEWFFEIPSSEEIFCIRISRACWTFDTISFTRMDFVDVPENALIR